MVINLEGSTQLRRGLIFYQYHTHVILGSIMKTTDKKG